MPSGKVHSLTTAITAGVVAPALVIVARQPVTSAVAFIAGCMVGLVVTPDLDVRYRDTHSETIVRHTGGCLVGAVWDLLWWPYARLIPRHRHPLSHWPVLGTATRLLYLLAVPALLWWGVSWFIPIPVLNLPQYNPLWGWALAGLVLVDGLHAEMDWWWRF